MEPNVAHRMNDSGVIDLFMPGCRQNYGKGMKIEINKAFG